MEAPLSSSSPPSSPQPAADEGQASEVEEANQREEGGGEVKRAEGRVETLRTQLAIARERRELELLFRQRAPHFSRAEFDGLYEWAVQRNAAQAEEEALNPRVRDP